MGFKLLNFHDKILTAIKKENLITPTPIQEQAVPVIMTGKDLLASAPTGTGKTAAFILPALHRLAIKDKIGKGPQILILSPTRELAMQIAKEASKFSTSLPHLKTVCIFGGVPYPLQIRQLNSPYNILVATPGRLIDHLERKRINLDSIEMIVLDEADRMLDMGFIKPVEHIASLAPSSSQVLLFSATLKKEVIKLSKKLLKNPTEIAITAECVKHEQIEQHFYPVDNIDHKHKLLNDILRDSNVNQAIVFTSTKRAADKLAVHLTLGGHHVSAFHGNMDQRKRMRTLNRLRNGQIRVLVATDVAARGIDILTISHVINFDLPTTAEDYVHRIGRTGRAGATGIAFSFAAKADRQSLRDIEKFTGQTIPIYNQSSTPTAKKKPPQRKNRFFRKRKPPHAGIPLKMRNS